jgi:glycosyltransferase involved in cell wall biosynthesis
VLTVNNSRTFAPIAIFAYNRLEHLERCIHSLLSNKEAEFSDVYIFSDGPKNELDLEGVTRVREFISKISGFRTVVTHYSTENQGLAKSIITGVSDLLSHHDTLIILEDDLCLSPLFLKYMNHALVLYEGEDNVASIQGYQYPIKIHGNGTFFLRGADCWGWGTWKRAWKNFNPNGENLYFKLKSMGLFKELNIDNSYPYLKMLKNQIKGKNDSWAVRWHASCIVNGMYSLYPMQSLVMNIGMDGTGQHCSPTSCYDVNLASSPIDVFRMEVKEDPKVKLEIKRFLRHERSLFNRVKRKISSYAKLLHTI